MSSQAHRRFLINELAQGFATIGPDYERFGACLIDFIVEEKMDHRGLTLHGHPVGHTVDSVSATGLIAAEYSSEEDYFEWPFAKIRKDLRHVHKMHPQAQQFYMLSSRICGPKAHTQLVNFRGRVKRLMGIDLKIFDARQQAEMIVDQLLSNDRAVDQLGAYLAPLAKVRDEYAATNSIPEPVGGYLHRHVIESELASRLRAERVVVLAGIGGTGKSETAATVARAMAPNFDIVVWVEAADINGLQGLQTVDILRRGRAMNLLHLLRDRSCLLILDDLRTPVALEALGKACGVSSAVLITRRIALSNDTQMPFLDRSEARALLEQELTPCPESTFNVVWEVVGGHPLAIRLMNSGVRQGSWDDLLQDCNAVGRYSDDRLQRLVDRLIGRIAQLLETELAFFYWCGSARADRAFARRVLSPVGLRKLVETCLLARDRNDVIRVHDVVFSAMQALQANHTFDSSFDALLESHIEELASDMASPLSFLNFCHIHRSLLERTLLNDSQRSTAFYCLAHVWQSREVDLARIPDPLEMVKRYALAPSVRDVEVKAVCEAIEVIYRKHKELFGVEAAREKLVGHLDDLRSLAQASGVSMVGRRTAMHHQAKTMRNLKRFSEAIDLCKLILTQNPNPATQLQLARLLALEKPPNPEGLLRSKELLFSLLEAAKAAPAAARISVTLAAVETFGYQQLKDEQASVLERFGNVVSDYIVEGAMRGLDHAYVAFAAIGRTWHYKDPAAFEAVFKELPRRALDEVDDDKERAAWGDILLSASVAAPPTQKRELATEAVSFYSAIAAPNYFHLQQKAHALVLLEHFEEATAVLMPQVEHQPNPWNRYWLSRAYFGLGDLSAAREHIDQALADPKGERFHPAMYEHRWEIRVAAGDSTAIEDLRKAHILCTDTKHKAALTAKLTDRGE